METPFLRRLRHGACLTPQDEATLTAGILDVREIQAGHDIIRDGDRPDEVRLVVEGVACRYKALMNGRRSIMALLVPGDVCDLHVAILGQMDHSLSALTACRVVSIRRHTIENWTERHPRINRALWWATLVDEAVLRAWLANIGGRRAPERIGHLLCELHLRLQTVGLATVDAYDLPLTQSDIGDATGLSVVHVNRVLKQLRTEDLATVRDGRVTLLDAPRLAKMVGFDASYLHLSGSAARGGMSEGERGEAAVPAT